MNKWRGIAILMLSSVATAALAETLEFDGEQYVRQFASNQPELRLLEFVRPGETLKNWTKLLGLRHFKALDDPAATAAALAKQLQRQNPQARFQLVVKDDGSQAVIDFVTWPESAEYMEFNVFRYLKQPGTPGLFSFQFAYRFTDASPEGTEKFKKLRKEWVDAVREASFPVDFVRKSE